MFNKSRNCPLSKDNIRIIINKDKSENYIYKFSQHDNICKLLRKQKNLISFSIIVSIFPLLHNFKDVI